MNVFLDYFLTFFHSAFVLFVLTGWMLKSTRKAHIIAIGLILIAWLGIGWYKGVIGYCPLTDWHWDIKRELGERNISSSFIEYMLEKITGIDLNRKLVDVGTAAGLILSVLCAGYVNLRSRISKRN
ncbi:DUF2784 domain-containing protein [Ekhidna sp.]|uniref:DUF2784 domain-containing protein n=1 Tax=Ekhidna sp. TaxID=2608089 RepID=UPI0032EBA1A3